MNSTNKQLSFFHPFNNDIRSLCRRYGVVQLHAFGSTLREDFSKTSDVDLLVVFSRTEKTNAFEQYFGFKEDLEKLLGREVDLVCYNAIRNPYFKKEVESTRQQIYVA